MSSCICPSHLSVHLVSFLISFSLNSICPLGDFNLSPIHQMAKVKYLTGLCCTCRENVDTMKAITSSPALYLLSELWYSWCHVTDFKTRLKMQVITKSKENCWTSRSSQPPLDCISREVPLGQGCLSSTNKAQDFKISQQQMVECGRRKEGQRKTRTCLTCLCCTDIKKRCLPRKKTSQTHHCTEENDSRRLVPGLNKWFNWKWTSWMN